MWRSLAAAALLAAPAAAGGLTLHDLAPRYDWKSAPAEPRVNPLLDPSQGPAPGVGLKVSNAGDRAVGVQVLSGDGGKTLALDTTLSVDTSGKPAIQVAPRLPELEKSVQERIAHLFDGDAPAKGPDAVRVPASTSQGTAASGTAKGAGPGLVPALPSPVNGEGETAGTPLVDHVRARPIFKPGRRSAGAAMSAEVLGAKVSAEGNGRMQEEGPVRQESRFAVEKEGVSAAVASTSDEQKPVAYQAGYRFRGGSLGGEYVARTSEKSVNSEVALGPGASLGTKTTLAPNQQTYTLYFRLFDLSK